MPFVALPSLTSERHLLVDALPFEPSLWARTVQWFDGEFGLWSVPRPMNVSHLARNDAADASDDVSGPRLLPGLPC